MARRRGLVRRLPGIDRTIQTGIYLAMQPEERQRRAIIVEDDHLVRGLMHDALVADKEVDWRVDTYDRAEPACDAVSAGGDWDVLSIDIHLPGMTGVAFIEWMRESDREIPVVVVSGASDTSAVLRCLEMGAADYVLKPFDIEVYRRALCRAADLKGVGAGLWRELTLSNPATGWLEISAPSEREFLFRFRQFSLVLLSARLSAKDTENLRLAAEELIHNAIEWGNRFDHQKRVSVASCLFGDRIVVKVEDEGEGFVPEDIDDPTIDPFASVRKRRESGKRPGGYGIHLVKAMMDEVVYSRRGNSVLFTKYLRQA